MNRVMLVAAVWLPSICPVRAEETANPVKVAVMGLKATAGIPPEFLESLVALIPEELERLGPFKAITTADINQMLAYENLKDQLGCTDVACLAEIGGALGVAYLISGNLTLVGDTYLLQLQLMDIVQARSAGRVAREYKGGPMGLLEEVRAATRLVVREVLAANSGNLWVRVSEEGANVELDGRIVGVSPLPPFSAGAGFHALEVQMEGFVVFRKDILIEPKRETVIDVELLPSGEYLRAYEKKAGFTRKLAWGGILAGGVAVAVGVTLYFVGSASGNNLSDDIEIYNQSQVHDPAVNTDLHNRKQTLTDLNLATVLTTAVGLGLSGVGTYLFFAGDPPNRYQVEPTIVLSGSKGAVGIGIQGGF